MPSENRTVRPVTRMSAFFDPIAHRGLHDSAANIEENSPAAFRAACEAGVGIECDIRLGSAATPLVFHDPDLSRLIGRPDRLMDLSASERAAIRYPGSRDAILSFGDLLDLVDGRVPLMCELKVDAPEDAVPLVDAVLAIARDYRGPLAIKSFSAAAITQVRAEAPTLPRGIVARDNTRVGSVDAARADRMAHLLDTGPAAPHFLSYRVSDLMNPVVRYVRQVVGLPVFAWTITSSDDLLAARPYADVPVFEGLKPYEVRALWTFNRGAATDWS